MRAWIQRCWIDDPALLQDLCKVVFTHTEGMRMTRGLDNMYHEDHSLLPA